MNNLNSIRFALIGCGRISRNHFEAIRNNPEAQLVAVCDEIEERAQKAGIENRVDFYTSYEKMLERKDIDVVSVCTPSGLHPIHGIMAAQKGYHVVCEKPMATTLEAADELIKTCEQKGVKLFVVKQNRLNSTLQLVKKAIDKGRFGKIYMVVVNVFWTRPQEYYDMAKWRGTWALDGGAFMNQASHYVDMLLWLFGDVEKVKAITGTLARNIETEDTGSAIIQFKNGAIGSINVTMLTYPKNLEGSLTIIGEKGTVKVGGTAVNKIEKWEFTEYDNDDQYVEQVNYTPPNVYGFGHSGYYHNIIDVLKNGLNAGTDGREGRRSLKLILDIYKQSSLC
ncbi:Gfo/Idh/MocA family protein [Petroclostridium xylanilyticum]|uniref:Gfo/Idh/MocA family protein n=1 Tax=Petroclostridium xylanilyticum TaxID=1792311 RepID=UPI000B99886B|nr:Gfo/Idh/MocA family oxidoreductase [Petroclostridium xylanilyticum]